MNILDILSKYNVELQQIGDIYRGYCPLHSDTAVPNFTVFTQTDSFFCFACGKGGKAVDFVRYIENITREEAQVLLDEELTTEDIKSRINAPSVQPTYNQSTNFVISMMCRDLLRAHPEKLESVMSFMEKFDSVSDHRVFDEEEGKRWIDSFSNEHKD